MYKDNFIIGFLIGAVLVLTVYCYNLFQKYIDEVNKPVIIEHKSKIPYTYLGKFHLTHYTHTGNRCANGHYPTLKTVAVDTKVIPMNSLLYIDGVGLRVAMDTGGAIKNNKLDVFVDSKDEAIKLGLKKNVDVYLLEDK